MGSRRSSDTTAPFFMEPDGLRVDAGLPNPSSESSDMVKRPSPSRLGSQCPAAAYRCDRNQLLVPLKISRSVIPKTPSPESPFFAARRTIAARECEQSPSWAPSPASVASDGGGFSLEPNRDTPSATLTTPVFEVANRDMRHTTPRNRHFCPTVGWTEVATAPIAIFMGRHIPSDRRACVRSTGG